VIVGAADSVAVETRWMNGRRNFTISKDVVYLRVARYYCNSRPTLWQNVRRHVVVMCDVVSAHLFKQKLHQRC
jgi:hypothetical protein